MLLIPASTASKAAGFCLCRHPKFQVSAFTRERMRNRRISRRRLSRLLFSGITREWIAVVVYEQLAQGKLPPFWSIADANPILRAGWGAREHDAPQKECFRCILSMRVSACLSSEDEAARLEHTTTGRYVSRQPLIAPIPSLFDSSPGQGNLGTLVRTAAGLGADGVVSVQNVFLTGAEEGRFDGR